MLNIFNYRKHTMSEWLQPKSNLNSYIVIVNTANPDTIKNIHNSYISKEFLAWGRLFPNSWIVFWVKKSPIIKKDILTYLKNTNDWIMVVKTCWVWVWTNTICSSDFIKKFI